MQKPNVSKAFLVRPLYAQLSFALVERLKEGKWRAGDALPNEAELSREYNLSQGTVRKALDWMEENRLIVRHQGRGTFVCDPASDEIHRLYERLCDSGGAPVAMLPDGMTTSEAEASDHECRRLGLRPGAKVRRTKRVRSISDAPCIIETSVVPAALFPLPEAEITSCDTLLDLAKRCGVLLGKGEERITAVAATDEAAAALACEPGEPLLHLDRVVYTLDMQPAEWRTALCRSTAVHYVAPVGRAK